MRHPRLGAALLALACAAVPAKAEVAAGDTSTKRIALSNAHAGNTWRLQMLQAWRDAAQVATAKGLLAAAPALTTEENSVAAQAAQIADLVAGKADAIVVNAASARGLDSAVKAACAAGVVVVGFDGVVEAPCAWRVRIDYAVLGRVQIEALAARVPEPARILELRGILGTPVDEAIAAGIREAIAATGGRMSIVASVNGDWTQSVAQREVAQALPTLGPVDAVVTQGGDGRGAATAFLDAGRTVPTVVLGNRRSELEWWKERRDASGYDTISVSIAPSTVQIAFWVAQQILAGADVPKNLVVPPLLIDGKALDAALAATPSGGLTMTTYDQSWTASFIAAAMNGAAIPASPLP